MYAPQVDETHVVIPDEQVFWSQEMLQAFQNVHLLSPNFAFHRRQDQAFRSKNKNANEVFEIFKCNF